MPIFVGTLARYFGLRFLTAVLLVFAGIFALVTLVDYIELMRRAGDIPNVSAVLVAKTSFYRVPQVVERILPFCILIGAMSCYLNLSRRLELVVARSAGLSAWQFVAPALLVAFVLGLMATAIYNPLSAILQAMELDPLTVADDPDFLAKIANQPNVPDYIRADLAQLY